VRGVRSFARFWYRFVVGDDLVAAIGLAVALVATALADTAGLHAWWLLPPAVALVLADSVRRAARAARAAHDG
jgi:hypothetical protein